MPQQSTKALTVPQPPYIVERPTGHTRPSPDDEWLLTIGNGGFAMGTASGVNRRKYHALLIASTRPPVDRLSCLASLDECLIFADASGKETERTYLSARRYTSGILDPNGPTHLVRFEKEHLIARWVYSVRGAEITKELSLAWKRNACRVAYSLRIPNGQSVRLFIEPRVTLRDFHSVNTATDLSRYAVRAEGDAMLITTDKRTLAIRCAHARPTIKPSFTRDVLLDFETERDQEDIEHLFNPGEFEIAIPPADPTGASRFTVFAALTPDAANKSSFEVDRQKHLSTVFHNFAQNNPALKPLSPLVDAADDYLVPRTVEGKELTTILAGFPWFTDWGRDTMISLLGLMLATRRFDDAKGALETFARYVKDGLIPNVFDDYGGPPQYNTVDASLWFLHACREYLRATNDRATFDALLLPACSQIVERYQSGTHFSIRMDSADSLIESGDETTQLTWMDAKRDGVVFTPRHGKPVEINALWHHGLLCLAECAEKRDSALSSRCRDLARRVAASFNQQFWHDGEQRLHDCLQRDAKGAWRPRPEIRPNQIFAAALEFSPLSIERRRAVVENVKRHLLTTRGLRTLAPTDPNYRPRFEGNMMNRDRAYHNGTVWPWLIGPYCEALLRADNFSASAKAEARAAVQPLIDSLTEGCAGQIAEVYDAEEPRRPQGCIAQAWSIAEVLRAAVLAAG